MLSGRCCGAERFLQKRDAKPLHSTKCLERRWCPIPTLDHFRKQRQSYWNDLTILTQSSDCVVDEPRLIARQFVRTGRKRTMCAAQHAKDSPGVSFVK